MPILLGIDGTGDLNSNDYRREMHNSFVSYILRSTRSRNKQYLRGPAALGLDMAWIAERGYRFIHLHRAAHPNEPILLTGYSRGGAGVIAVAQRLQRDGVQVAAMMLFDAVDRAIGIDTARIPDNVRNVMHARRNPNSLSRLSFDSCGTQWSASTQHTSRHFMCTHGGVGGVPWTPEPGQSQDDQISEFGELVSTRITFRSDMQGARQVWQWSNSFIQKFSFL